MAGSALLGACGGTTGEAPAEAATAARHAGTARVAARSILDRPATACPIDHVVVLMMENRSFDHWLGWLADDQAWLDRGRKRYGRSFSIAGDQTRTFPDPVTGSPVGTAHLPELLAAGNPWRGCDHPDPGHSWTAGRAERDQGFLATASGNDRFALGYYRPDDLPFTSSLARRFTVCDRSHASLLGPTYPNREYLHSAQSGGIKNNSFPTTSDGFGWPTIWEKLLAAGVSCGYYYTDLPVTALWGPRLTGITKKVDEFFARAAAGTLPQVSFVDPGFLGPTRTDNHPHGDVRAGERFQRDVFAAFARSSHWRDGLFVLTYDEWGGFFDHKPPVKLPDDRASADDIDDFGQAGFRVPTVLASPYAQPGAVDHRLYDHTSVLRFLEWRYLGAPAEGPGRNGATWFLTSRDRRANNLGASLVTNARRDVGFDLDVAIDAASPDCDATDGSDLGAPTGTSVPNLRSVATPDPHSFEVHFHEGEFERMGYRPEPSLMAKEWTAGLTD